MEENIVSLVANFEQFIESAKEYALLAQAEAHEHRDISSWINNGIASAFGASVGAVLSFVFMYRLESKRCRESENNFINHAIQNTLLNIQSLCNYKHNYLYHFDGFFDELEKHADQYVPNMCDEAREKLAEEWYITFAPKFLGLLKEYKDEVIRSGWNGLLREFQDWPPLYEFDIERLYFISSNKEEAPNLTALLSQANHNLKSLENLKVMRKEVFISDKHLAPYILQFAIGKSTDNDPKFEDVMTSLFKFLNIRSTIKLRVDTCLIAQQVCYLLLGLHQKKNYQPTVKSARKNKINYWYKKRPLTPMYIHVSGSNLNSNQMPELPACSKELTRLIGACISDEEYEYIRKSWDVLNSSPLRQ